MLRGYSNKTSRALSRCAFPRRSALRRRTCWEVFWNRLFPGAGALHGRTARASPHGLNCLCFRIDLLKGPAAWRGYHAAANKFTRRIAASVGANVVGALHVAPRHNIQTGGEAQKPEDRGVTAATVTAQPQAHTRTCDRSRARSVRRSQHLLRRAAHAEPARARSCKTSRRCSEMCMLPCPIHIRARTLVAFETRDFSSRLLARTLTQFIPNCHKKSCRP